MTLPRPRSDWAVFLDFDGSIVEFAATPDKIQVDDSLAKLLSEISRTLNGALAIVSGRSIVQLDRYLDPYRFAAVGLHGFEWRRNDGVLERATANLPDLKGVVRSLEANTVRHSGVLVEDKGVSIAIHFRGSPESADICRRAALNVLQDLGRRFEMLEGKMVIEIKPRGIDKGRAIKTFLRKPPFAGRVPVFCGDDVTDEHGFEFVNGHSGISIKIGNQEPTAAAWRAESVSELVEWLGIFPDAVEGSMSRRGA